MAVRILADQYQYLDPMSGASTAGMAFVYEDGERMPPWEPRPGYGQNELIASESLRLMNIPREQIRMQRPPVPQMLFAPKYGYEGIELTIEDVFSNQWTPRPRSWTSGPPRTPGRAFEEDTFSGTLRNQMSSSPMQ